jgi:hypothetical protein
MLGKLFADFAVERHVLYRQEVLLAGMPGLVRILGVGGFLCYARKLSGKKCRQSVFKHGRKRGKAREQKGFAYSQINARP